MAYSSVVLADAPRVYYRFEDNPASSTMSDSSGNGNHGSYQGAVTRGAAGLLAEGGASADFPDVSGQRDYYPSWTTGSAYSAEAWFRPDNATPPAGTGRTIMGHDTNGSALTWRLFINTDGRVQIFHTDIGGTFRIVTSTTVIVPGLTYHVVATWDGATLCLYLNGVLEGSVAAASVWNSGSPLNIGSLYSGSTSEHFDGRLDEVAVYGTALSQARVTAHYQAGSTVAPAILLQDDFNRANSTTSLGSPAVGGPYTVRSGTWGINNAEAYLSTPAANAHLTFPAAVNVDISAKVPVSPSSQVASGITIRWVDANNHWLFQAMSGPTLALYRCTAGVYTQMYSGGPFTVGDVIGLKAFGDQIAWYSNGRQLGQLADHWFATAGTDAGLRNSGTSTARWDDLLVREQLTPLNSWGAPPSIETVPKATITRAGEFALTPSLYKGRNTALADESETP
jgi:hypothetical protein